MNFINGQMFFYIGRRFKVVSKWNQKGCSDEWTIELENQETGEIVQRKLGLLRSLWKENKINQA